MDSLSYFEIKETISERLDKNITKDTESKLWQLGPTNFFGQQLGFQAI